MLNKNANRGIHHTNINIEKFRYQYKSVANTGAPIEIRLSTPVDIPITSHWCFSSTHLEKRAPRVEKESEIHRTQKKYNIVNIKIFGERPIQIKPKDIIHSAIRKLTASQKRETKYLIERDWWNIKKEPVNVR